LTREHECHFVPGVDEVCQRLERLLGLDQALDAVVPGVAPDELSLDVFEGVSVFVNDEEDGKGHLVCSFLEAKVRGIEVQVLEHEHERQRVGYRVQGLKQLAEHPVARRTNDPAADRLELAVRHQPRHLRKPHRRVTREQLNDLLAAFVTTQTAKRLQDR
jgi:hypothetical protein